MIGNRSARKNFVPAVVLIVYCAILIKVMVFKDIPTIRIGALMLNFSGTNAGHAPNFVPFKTIAPYLLGYKGWIIAGVNLAGNIGLLVPVGFLAPLVFRTLTWKSALAIAVAAGLSIEVMQTVLHVGIFDIDDVTLNALGVMIGYSAFRILAQWIRLRRYKTLAIAGITAIAATAVFYGGVVYPMTHHPLDPAMNADAMPERSGDGAEQIPKSRDLCGGTGGTGQIVAVGNHGITIRRQDGVIEALALTPRTTIRTSAGSASESDLKAGDRVTIVVYDGKNVQTVLRCE